MSASATIPVTITPEAAARVAELGMQQAVEQMIEHTRQTVPALRRIELILEPPYDTGDDPYLTIQAHTDRPFRREDTTEQEWGMWKITTFAPQIYQHIAMQVHYGDYRAG